MEEMVIYRTVLLAKKLLIRGDQPRILRSFAKECCQNNEWIVEEPKDSCTDIARRSFSSRVKRIWSVISEDIKSINVNSRENKKLIKDEVTRLDAKWILWGGNRTTEESNEDTEMAEDQVLDQAEETCPDLEDNETVIAYNDSTFSREIDK